MCAHTHATAFEDRAEQAEAVMGILPALVQHTFDRPTAQKWFHPMALMDIDDIEFETDDSGNWTGSWRTPDSNAEQMIIDEDLGFNIVLEGLDLLQTTSRPILTTEDASVNTFGPAFGRPARRVCLSRQSAE